MAREREREKEREGSLRALCCWYVAGIQQQQDSQAPHSLLVVMIFTEFVSVDFSTPGHCSIEDSPLISDKTLVEAAGHFRQPL